MTIECASEQLGQEQLLRERKSESGECGGVWRVVSDKRGQKLH